MRKPRQYKQTSYRLPVTVKELIERLADELDTSEVGVLKQALKEFAERHGMEKAS